MSIEEQYTDVLQNLELAVAQAYQSHPEMTDYAVLRAYEALVQTYSAEIQGRDPKPVRLSDLETELMQAIKSMCEVRLGRSQLPGADKEAAVEMPAIDVATLILCLKRLAKSVEKWTKRGGRKGYLDFMSQFVK